MAFKVYSFWKNITRKFQNLKSPEIVQWRPYTTSHLVCKNKPNSYKRIDSNTHSKETIIPLIK